MAQGGERGDDVLAMSDAELAAFVQAAVERFVDRHAGGETVDLGAFVATFPEPAQPRILAQCREFLAFDGLVGGGRREPPLPAATPVGTPGHGRRFGDFVIEEELGRGGMGVVYLARQTSLQRRVALKVMASGLALSKRHVERFRREAAAAAQLRHPGIVAVHSLIEAGGDFAIAMDYVAGRNLGDILDDLRLAAGADGAPADGSLGIAPGKGHVAECAVLVAQVASALAAAHRQGVVHRDLKPRNLMIDELRQPRLLDFGLAKSLGDGSLSMSGELAGTVHYMSPEQTLAKRVDVDHRADLFALGVILYELLTLRRPFDGKNLQQVVYAICFQEPVPPQRHNPKVPRDLATVCLKALEKDPAKRYQSAAEFEADLQRFLRWEPVLAKPAGPVSRLGKWVRRHRSEAIATGCVVALSASGLGYQFHAARAEAQQADQQLQLAVERERTGDLVGALDAATAALALRDEPTTRARIELYRQKLETFAKQQEADAARAANLQLKSNEQLAKNRALAIQLALAAHDVRSSAESRSTVLQSLGGGFTAMPLAGLAGRTLGARWAPDGSAVLTFGTAATSTPRDEPGIAIVWNPDGSQRHTLHGHAGWILDAEFLPDGERLLTAGVDRTVRVWDVRSGAALGVWQHAAALRALVLDRAGRLALTCGDDVAEGRFEAQIRRVADGGVVASGPAHRRMITAAALSSCGTLAATAGDPGYVVLWRTTDGSEIARLPGIRQMATAAVFSPDGRQVAIGDYGGRIAVFATADGALLAEGGHAQSVNSLQFAPDGARLLSAAEDRTARLWRLADASEAAQRLVETQPLLGARAAVLGAAFDASGSLLVTAGKDGALRVYDLAGTELAVYEVGETALREATFDPSGQRVLCWHRGGALVWDFADARGVVTLRQPGLRVPSVCFDGAGERVLTAGDDERLRAWDARSGRQLWATPKLGNPLAAVAADPRHARAVATTVRGAVYVVRLADGERLFELVGHGDKAVPFVRWFGPAGRLFSAGGDGNAIVWDPATQRDVVRLSLGAAVVAADADPTGAVLATVTAGDERRVRLWNAADGSACGELHHVAALRTLAFRPDGQALLLGDGEGLLCIVDLQGRELQRFAGKGALVQAAWRADGQAVLSSASGDGNWARLWNLASGELELAFTGHADTVGSSAFHPDGQWAVTASRDGTARIWPTDPIGVARRLPLAPLSAADRARFGLPR